MNTETHEIRPLSELEKKAQDKALRERIGASIDKEAAERAGWKPTTGWITVTRKEANRQKKRNKRIADASRRKNRRG